MKFFRIILFVLVSFSLTSIAAAGPRKVYLVNGLLSKALGYGLTNLSKKIPGARHFKFSGSVTRAAVDGIIADATRAYKRDPSVRISLIGISQGANAVTRIASTLNSRGVKVYYLATIEGGRMSPIQSNVRKSDNFICNGSDCTQKSPRKAGGNKSTVMSTFKISGGHVASANHPKVHRRILSQI